LNGRQDDFDFYTAIIEKLIKHNCNYNSRTTRLRGERSNTSRIDIGSVSQVTYLKKLGLVDEQNKFILFPFEELPDQSMIKELQLAYLMGMMAAGGHITARKNHNTYSPILQFSDKNLQYVPEIKRVVQELNLALPFSSGPKRPDRLVFGKRSLEAMVSHEVPFRISEQQGLFVNPRHISALEKYGLISR